MIWGLGLRVYSAYRYFWAVTKVLTVSDIVQPDGYLRHNLAFKIQVAEQQPPDSTGCRHKYYWAKDVLIFLYPREGMRKD